MIACPKCKSWWTKMFEWIINDVAMFKCGECGNTWNDIAPDRHVVVAKGKEPGDGE